MKKLVSLLLVAVMLSASFLTIPVTAEEPVGYFEVNFDSVFEVFTVTANPALAGENRVLLLVKDGNNTIYMDAMNAVTYNNVYFTVDLGEALESKEYEFILSSDGDTVTKQILTCMAEVPDVPKFFSVEYDESEGAFNVNSVEGYYTGTNRVILTVYEPSFNGYQEIYYMDVRNNAKSFNFSVPVSQMAPIGDYAFRVSVIGDMMDDGFITCHFNRGFSSYTEEVEEGIKMGGKYILKDGEEDDGIAVYVALYNKTEDGDDSRLVRVTYSDEVVDNYIQADITLSEEEQTADYYVKVFVWNQTTLYPLASSIAIDKE